MNEKLAKKSPRNRISSSQKPEKKLREKRLNIRFSEEEFALIEAKADGMSLARYARALLTKGHVPRRERDYPNVDPKLLQQIHSMGRNLNQLVRYTHSQANAKRPIDVLNLALAIENMNTQLQALKQQYTAMPMVVIDEENPDD